MASANASAQTGFKRDKHGAAPAFDHTYTENISLRPKRCSGYRRREGLRPARGKSATFSQLAKPDYDTGCDISGGLGRHSDLRLVVWRP
jgi:hypothetical protein